MKSMDIADYADEHMAQVQAARIAEIRSKTGPKPTGRCFYCGAPLEPEQLFCDADCRDDYEFEQAAKERKGRV